MYFLIPNLSPFFQFFFYFYSDEHSAKVKSFMLDIMCPLISESDTVSHELLDIILINVVEPNKTQRRNAYALAKELINKCSDTLEPYIQAVGFIYFPPLKLSRISIFLRFFL